MKDKGSTTLHCFSPPIMVATILLELVLFLYVMFRYKMSSIARLITTTLLLLATFQIAEFFVCSVGGETVETFSRLGFIAITMLPPLGIHLIKEISGRGSLLLVGAAYASGGAFAIMFGFNDLAFAAHACTGNYVIFQLIDGLGGTFFAYYYFWLLLGISMALYFSIEATKKVRIVLIYQVVGYLIFLLPTGIVNALRPETINGIPSIMCGFAVIYALILVFGIAPLVARRQK